MVRILGAGFLALTLAGVAPATAGEPIQLDDFTLDMVTAGATALAGFQIRLDPGNSPVVIDTVAAGHANGPFDLSGSLSGPTGEAGVNVAGDVTTQTTPYSAVSIARIGGLAQELGTGTAAVDPSVSASGQNVGFGSAIIPIAGEDGITEYVGASWAWAYDIPPVVYVP